MEKMFDRLKKEWDDDPMKVIMMAGSVAAGSAALLNALTARKNSRVWKKEVKRRIKQNKK